jgi:hypothetical protein
MLIAANDNSSRPAATARKGWKLPRAAGPTIILRPRQAQRYGGGKVPVLDDASLATFGRDRRELEIEARRPALC